MADVNRWDWYVMTVTEDEGERCCNPRWRAICKTITNYSHTEPLFKQLNLLKVEDILTLQELKFYFKYNQGILPIYLQNWNFNPNSKIHNHNTRRIATLHTFKTKHEVAKKRLKYNLPYTINNTPHIVKDKVNTHSFQGFSLYVKKISDS